MAPKVKITKDDIVKTALDLVRKSGAEAINARAVAAALDCSTQPVFSNFDSMESLKAAVIRSGYDLYLGFLKNEVDREKYPRYKAYGMAYVRFAKEERELFKLLFMRDRTGEDISPSTDFNESVEMIMKANSITYEKAMLMHLEIWACVHGIGVMIATSFLSFDFETVSNMLSDVYQGIKVRFLLEENK